MTRSYCRLWVHAVFGTKYRQPLITKNVEAPLYSFMSEQLHKCECLPVAINGTPDHIHLLFLSNYKMSVADTLKQVKGSSSYWVNQNKLCHDRFGWQDSFGGFSVSEQDVQMIKRYIARQKIHHVKKTFSQEYEEFLRNNGVLTDVSEDPADNAG